ncbi:MAG: glycosyltransferase family 4 protein [Acidimicrobiales bacterium]
MTRHLLVTNDYPPKLGGIQQYLWELWRRLDPDTFTVITTPYDGTDAFDAEQTHRIIRSREPWLAPYPWLVGRLNDAATGFDAAFHVIDPAVPLGMIGPHLDRPYAVVLHGAEVAVPGRIPGSKQTLARVLDNAIGVISAGHYALDEAERAVGRRLQSVVIPPGVDTAKFRPIPADDQAAIRVEYGIDPSAPFILSVSRLVPRKGMDTLVAAAGRLQRWYPDLVVGIAGDGRDRRRLARRIAATGAPVRLLGRVSDEDKAALYSAADIFAMLCRNRWAGLEQEGFGIVFVEAAAAGTPQVAGESGGAAEAVAHGETGLVVPAGASLADTVTTFRMLLDDAKMRAEMGERSRVRACEEFSYDVLADRLAATLRTWSE